MTFVDIRKIMLIEILTDNTTENSTQISAEMAENEVKSLILTLEIAGVRTFYGLKVFVFEK